MHKSPSGKVYIGITGRTVKQRWHSPLLAYKNNPIFTSAIKKYGWENIEHIILYENLNKISAITIEIDLIYYYKKVGLCYNITDGGEGFLGLKHDEEWMQHLAERNAGNQFSVGIPASGEEKEKIREKIQVREKKLRESGYYDIPIDSTPKKVTGINIKDSSDVITFNSITDAARAVNRTRANIRSAISRNGTCAGYKWNYS